MKRLSKGQKMRRVRAQAMLVHRLQEQMRGRSPGVRSVVMTGMPSGRGGLKKGLDVQIAQRDALERMIGRECRRLRDYEKDAREEMDLMRPGMYAFCSLYYLTGMSIEDTAEMIDRSLRQCNRYRAEIEGNECGEEEYGDEIKGA